MSPAVSFGGLGGEQSFTEPPAFSIAATADFDAPATSKVELRLEFAVAEDLHAVARLASTTPAAISASTVTAGSASSFPASIACWMRPRLTSLKSVGEEVR